MKTHQNDFENNFCIFILTNGRADKVITYNVLMKIGCRFPIFLVIDDEDPQGELYKQKYGEKVIVFNKYEARKAFDMGDNFNDKRCVVYARNACFEICEKLGFKYFLQLDDDYNHFSLRYCNKDAQLKHLSFTHENDLFNKSCIEILNLLENTNFITIAMSQNGDYIGGANGGMIKKIIKRKAMNSFFCSVERKFNFCGTINEDVNMYVSLGRRGELVGTVGGISLEQKQTQSNSGGLTTIYLDKGTYVKSFYSVMYEPSCVKITKTGVKKSTQRIHHRISWNNCCPKIISEEIKK